MGAYLRNISSTRIRCHTHVRIHAKNEPQLCISLSISNNIYVLNIQFISTGTPRCCNRQRYGEHNATESASIRIMSYYPAGQQPRSSTETRQLTIKTANDKVNRTEIRTYSPATRLQPSVSVKHPGTARPGWILRTLELVQQSSRFAKVPRTDDSFGTSVRLHWTIQLPPDGFSYNFIFGGGTKIWRENPSLVKIGQKNRGAEKSLVRPEGKKLQRHNILMFIYPIYNHNWRNISTIYIYNTSIKRNILTIKQNTSGGRSGKGLISTPVSDTLHEELSTFMTTFVTNVTMAAFFTTVVMVSNVATYFLLGRGARRLGIWIPVGTKKFSSPKRPGRIWDSRNPLLNGYRGPSAEVKQRRRDVGHSPSPSTVMGKLFWEGAKEKTLGGPM
jgi:hypothetical protein